jgi:biofilm PGA synthesis N-glycosyltransferase PgaC
LFFLIYRKNKSNFFDVPELKKHFSISVIVPAYNEGRTIEETVEAILRSDYDNIKEIILVNDGSKDDTLKYMNSLAERFPIVKVLDKQNSGKADSINQAIKIARGELIAVIDADSFPSRDAFSKTVGFFEDKLVGVATIPILSRRSEKFLDKIHSLYQILVASNRKLLEKIDGIFVTPGPFALYRKKALKEIGGFDTNNLTEDVEATWHLASKGWKRKMCMATSVTTLLPNKFKAFFRQRVRWTLGGFQTIQKYKKELFNKNIVGYFILPFSAMSIILGFFTLLLVAYLAIRRIITFFIVLNSAIISNTELLQPFSINLIPSVFFFYFILIVIFSGIFSLCLALLLEKKILHRRNLLFLLEYVLFFSIVPVLVFITAIFKFVKKDFKW